MEEDWKAIVLEVLAYKETGTYIMRANEDSSQLLDDHIAMTQSMAFSPYKKPFEQRIQAWENKLKITQVKMTCGSRLCTDPDDIVLFVSQGHKSHFELMVYHAGEIGPYC